jgi:hypothetical protein
VHVAAGQADVTDRALVAQRQQGLHRAARAAELVEVVVLRVVQIHQGEVVQAQPLLALDDAGPHPLTRVVASLGVHLGGDQEVVGQPAVRNDAGADAALALAVAVAVGGVQKADRAVQDGLHELDRVVGRDLVTVVLRHAAQRGAADADCRDLQPGGAQRPDPVGAVRRRHD